MITESYNLPFTNEQVRFNHSIDTCRMRRFLSVIRSFFHSSLFYTLSFHPSPPTILPSSLTSSCHLFLGLPLNLVVYKFIYNTVLGIIFSSILWTCPNQRNLFNIIASSAHHGIPPPHLLTITNITDDDISPSWHNHTNPINHHHHTFGWKPDDGRNRPKHVVTIIFIGHL